MPAKDIQLEGLLHIWDWWRPMDDIYAKNKYPIHQCAFRDFHIQMI